MENNNNNNKYTYNSRSVLKNTIDHLTGVLELIEMRDTLQARVDTYTVENTAYNLLDHRTDVEILRYLNNRIQDKKRIKTNYQYA